MGKSVVIQRHLLLTYFLMKWSRRLTVSVRHKHVMVVGRAVGLYLLLEVLLMAFVVLIPHIPSVAGDTSVGGLVMVVGNKMGESPRQTNKGFCVEDSKQFTNHWWIPFSRNK